MSMNDEFEAIEDNSHYVGRHRQLKKDVSREKFYLRLGIAIFIVGLGFFGASKYMEYRSISQSSDIVPSPSPTPTSSLRNTPITVFKAQGAIPSAAAAAADKLKAIGLTIEYSGDYPVGFQPPAVGVYYSKPELKDVAQEIAQATGVSEIIESKTFPQDLTLMISQ